MKRRHGKEEGSKGGRCGGANRRLNNNFGPTWQTHRNLKKEEDYLGDRNTVGTKQEMRGRTGLVFSMLGHKREAPRWADDIVWQS